VGPRCLHLAMVAVLVGTIAPCLCATAVADNAIFVLEGDVEAPAPSGHTAIGELGSTQGRRGGGSLQTAGSFVMSSGNRAGNSERQLIEQDIATRRQKELGGGAALPKLGSTGSGSFEKKEKKALQLRHVADFLRDADGKLGESNACSLKDAVSTLQKSVKQQAAAIKNQLKEATKMVEKPTDSAPRRATTKGSATTKIDKCAPMKCDPLFTQEYLSKHCPALFGSRIIKTNPDFRKLMVQYPPTLGGYWSITNRRMTCDKIFNPKFCFGGVLCPTEDFPAEVKKKNQKGKFSANCLAVNSCVQSCHRFFSQNPPCDSNGKHAFECGEIQVLCYKACSTRGKFRGRPITTARWRDGSISTMVSIQHRRSVTLRKELNMYIQYSTLKTQSCTSTGPGKPMKCHAGKECTPLRAWCCNGELGGVAAPSLENAFTLDPDVWLTGTEVERPRWIVRVMEIMKKIRKFITNMKCKHLKKIKSIPAIGKQLYKTLAKGLPVIPEIRDRMQRIMDVANAVCVNNAGQVRTSRFVGPKCVACWVNPDHQPKGWLEAQKRSHVQLKERMAKNFEKRSCVGVKKMQGNIKCAPRARPRARRRRRPRPRPRPSTGRGKGKRAKVLLGESSAVDEGKEIDQKMSKGQRNLCKGKYRKVLKVKEHAARNEKKGTDKSSYAPYTELMNLPVDEKITKTSNNPFIVRHIKYLLQRKKTKYKKIKVPLSVQELIKPECSLA